ncbi:MAG TPA: mechanosensitive ion channel domain-containing protein [Candidatus Polarisedimenticolaceae bacterium]
MRALAVYATLLIAGSTAPVRIGEAVVLQLQGDPARADRATAALEAALADPACGPEEVVVVRDASGTSLSICGARLLEVTEDDAAWEGLSVDATAARWVERVRRDFVAEKAERYSGALLRRAVAGLVYPLLLLAAILLARLGFRRWRKRLLEPQGRARGIRLGPLHLLATSGERRFLATLVGAASLLVYLLLAYAFVVALFREIPRTRGWARSMLEPLGTGLREAGPALVLLVPRLIVVGVVLVLLRLVLRSLTRLFEQVRRGEFRAEPFLTPETAGPAELTVRLAAIAAALFVVTLLLPGGQLLQFGFLLAGVALALGAYGLAANALAGVMTIYFRPFHRGDRVRLGTLTGTVSAKGLLHVALDTDDGERLLVPNRILLETGVAVPGPERALAGEIVVVSARGIDAAVGLIRHAAVEAGLKRDAGRVDLHAVRDARLVFRVDWPLDRGAACAEVRAQFLRGLLEHGPGLEVTVVSALAKPSA